MNKLLKISALFLLILSSCNESVVLKDFDAKIINISTAEIATRIDDGNDSNESESSLFKPGDKITVVGATHQPINFILTEDGDWRTDKMYEWLENPTIVRAYFGKDEVISNGSQMPDFLVAEYNCGGIVPEGGVLSFVEDGAFEHATALIAIDIKNWPKQLAPKVVLKDFHNVTTISGAGEYICDQSLIYSINMECVAEEGQNYKFEARVPAGTELVPNILGSYSIMVDDINILTYQIDEELIPTYYKLNSRFTYRLNYTTNN